MPQALSPRPVATLVELVADGYTHTTLRTLFIKLGLEGFLPDGDFNKEAKVQAVVERIRSRMSPADAERILRALAAEFLGRWGPNTELPGHVDPLVRALQADGWLWERDRLVPSTPAPADLAPEVEGLERELGDLGLKTAASHYRQAVTNFAQGPHEASNGQLRSFLENLFIESCARVSGRSFQDPSAALQHLKQQDLIDGGEYNVTRGLLELSNNRGAHHGLTDTQEALFRIHFSTSVARYLLARLGLAS